MVILSNKSEDYMKSSIKFAAIIMLFFGAFVISGCFDGGGSGGGGGTNLGNVTDLKTSNVGSIFTGIVKLQPSRSNRSLGRSSSSTFRTLSHINSDGNNEPIIFTTDNGNDVTLKITEIAQVNDYMIAFEYEGIIKVTLEEDGVVYDAEESVWGKKGLINFQTGKVYDISDYSIDNIITNDNNIFMVSSGSGVWGTLYKININEFAHAIPLNNSMFNIVESISFVTKNDKIIGRANDAQWYSYDINGIIPPQTVKFKVIEGSNLEIGTREYSVSIAGTTMIDVNGDHWVLGIWGIGIATLNPEKYYAISKVTIDDYGNTIVADHEEGELSFALNTNILAVFYGSSNTPDYGLYNSKNYYYSNRLYLVETRVDGVDGFGYIYVGTKADGGIEITDHGVFDNPLPVPLGGNSLILRDKGFIRYGNYFYWMEGKEIKKMMIQKSNEISTVYADNALEPKGGFSIVGDNLIFYKSITATNIGTYRLKIGESTPELISEHDAEIRDVVELTF